MLSLLRKLILKGHRRPIRRVHHARLVLEELESRLAPANIFSWTGADNNDPNNWEDPKNWNLNAGFPQQNDTAIIPVGAAPGKWPQVKNGEAVKSLQVQNGANLYVLATLQVSDPVTNNGHIGIDGGTGDIMVAGGAGAFTNNASVSFVGGRLDAASFTNKNGATVTTSLYCVSARPISETRFGKAWVPRGKPFGQGSGPVGAVDTTGSPGYGCSRHKR